MNAPKELGTAWERRVADHAASLGLPWDRAPLRGTRDLLDIQGCLPDGWLVGCKAVTPRGEQVRKNGMSAMSQKMSEGMAQCDRAVANLPESEWGKFFSSGDVVPVQVVQRVRYPVGQAYVVMTYDRFLRLVLMRREWEA